MDKLDVPVAEFIIDVVVLALFMILVVVIGSKSKEKIHYPILIDLEKKNWH